MKLAAGHYVYMLLDPRNGEVFYIGKGQGNRALHHARDVRTGREKNAAKALRISEIHAEGREVEVEVLASFEDAADAFDLERLLISDLKAGLTNIANGSRAPQCRLRAGLALAQSRLARMPSRDEFALSASPLDLLLYDYVRSALRVQVSVFQHRLDYAI